jgi:hypothetical protein
MPKADQKTVSKPSVPKEEAGGVLRLSMVDDPPLLEEETRTQEIPSGKAETPVEPGISDSKRVYKVAAVAVTLLAAGAALGGVLAAGRWKKKSGFVRVEGTARIVREPTYGKLEVSANGYTYYPRTGRKEEDRFACQMESKETMLRILLESGRITDLHCEGTLPQRLMTQSEIGAPVLSLSAREGIAVNTGYAGQPIALPALYVDDLGKGALQVEIGGLPLGSVLSDGEHSFIAETENARANVTDWQHGSLSFETPRSGTFTLKVKAEQGETLTTKTTQAGFIVTVLPLPETGPEEPPVTSESVNGDGRSATITFHSQLGDPTARQRKQHCEHFIIVNRGKRQGQANTDLPRIDWNATPPDLGKIEQPDWIAERLTKPKETRSLGEIAVRRTQIRAKLREEETK